MFRGVDDEGTVVIAKMAGIESTANTRSANSIRIRGQHQRRQVGAQFAVLLVGWRTRNFSPCKAVGDRHALAQEPQQRIVFDVIAFIAGKTAS